MWFKYRARSFCLQGVWGLTCESSEQDKKAKARFRITDLAFAFIIFKNLQILCYYSP